MFRIDPILESLKKDLEKASQAANTCDFIKVFDIMSRTKEENLGALEHLVKTEGFRLDQEDKNTIQTYKDLFRNKLHNIKDVLNTKCACNLQ